MTTLTLLGADGSSWDLLDPLSPTQLVGGMGGLHLPTSTGRWTQTARRSGRRFKDAVTDYRQFTMTVRVGDVIPPFRVDDDWRALDGQFWNSLRTDATSTLVMNGNRSLTFRLDDSNEHEFPQDPSMRGQASYLIACVADRPEWLGNTAVSTYTFGPDTGTDYYNGVSLGPPFTISAPSVSRRASISNVGDLPAYPVWTITGPATSARVGVGSRVISIPFPLLAGQQVIIDTEALTIVDAQGNSYWPQMGSQVVDFAPIPPGGQVQIVVGLENGTATSEIDVRLTPRFRRAWGGGTG